MPPHHHRYTAINLTIALLLTLAGLIAPVSPTPTAGHDTCQSDMWQPAPTDRDRAPAPIVKPPDAIVTTSWRPADTVSQAATPCPRDHTGRTTPPQPPSG